MRISLITAALLVCACDVDSPPEPPPFGRFYYPSGIAHVNGASASSAGTLYVASADFDKRYELGAISAVNLDQLDWPTSCDGKPIDLKAPHYLTGAAAGGVTACSPVPAVEDLKTTEENQVAIAPFAGIMAKYVLPSGAVRLFVPTRSEKDQLFVADATGTDIKCRGSEERDCTLDGGVGSLSLTQQAVDVGEGSKDGFGGGKPRAPEPYSATVRQSDGRMFVTHITQADSPLDSNQSRESFIVTADANDPAVDANSFIPIGVAPSNTVAIGQRFAYVSGRAGINVLPPIIRLVERNAQGEPVVLAPALTEDFGVTTARALVLSEDESRLYVVSREPDMLLVLAIIDPTSDQPDLRLVRAVPLPPGPNDAQLIPRGAGRGSLLAITCTTAGALVIYDDDVGDIATAVTGVGAQPYGIAVQRSAGPGARIFVSNFADGRVALVDLPDVNTPTIALLAAFLGRSQACLVEQQTSSECAAEAEADE